ncbi:hypothetical protein P7K49_023066 [Saguinus oedipus]|uniref:Uncharacterized protein n=1 Tax=Saguinus oedipus TaxID=9490 RepID=A0ABQ9ULF6_SAGOE|nr:hypothetical protein P7K49_023066 [Saguinus oedipus]
METKVPTVKRRTSVSPLKFHKVSKENSAAQKIEVSTQQTTNPSTMQLLPVSSKRGGCNEKLHRPPNPMLPDAWGPRAASDTKRKSRRSGPSRSYRLTGQSKAPAPASAEA